MKKILNLLYFSRLVGYVFVGQLFLLGFASIVGMYKENFGTWFVKLLMYSYIEILPEKSQNFFFAPCSNFGCLIPPLNIWGRLYNAVVILGILYLIACFVQLLWDLFGSWRENRLAKKANLS